MSTRLVPALLLALAALPAAPAGAATWSDPARVADAGQSSAPRLAGDPGGRLAVAFLRRTERPRQDPVIRAEVRLGTARDGLRGDSIVLTDGQTAFADDVDIAYPGTTGDLAVGWHGVEGRVRRALATTIDAQRAVQPARDLAPADSVAFAGGAGDDLLLALPRGTTFQTAPFANGRFTPVREHDGSPAQVAAVDARGTLVLAWTSGRTVRVAQRPRGGTLSAPAEIASPGFARAPRLAVTADGHVVVVWLSNEGQGNAVMAAAREPSGGAFGPARHLTGPVGAFAPRVAGSAAGELLVTFVRTGQTAGFGNRPGPVEILRATPDATRVSPAVRLSTGSERAYEAPIDGHAADAAYVAWSAVGRGAHPLRVRRVAPGGIVGALRTLARDRASGPPAVLGLAGGRAAVAWAEDLGGRPRRARLLLSIYR